MTRIIHTTIKNWYIQLGAFKYQSFWYGVNRSRFPPR